MRCKDRLIDWLIDRLIDWLIDRSIDWSIVWLIDWLIVRLIHWLIDWLIRNFMLRFFGSLHRPAVSGPQQYYGSYGREPEIKQGQFHCPAYSSRWPREEVSSRLRKYFFVFGNILFLLIVLISGVLWVSGPILLFFCVWTRISGPASLSSLFLCLKNFTLLLFCWPQFVRTG